MAQHELSENVFSSFVYLSLAKFFERLGYWSIRSILILYLVDSENGLGWESVNALSLVGTFALFVIIFQIVGGLIADFVLGTKRTLILAVSISSLGLFLLSFTEYVYLSIVLISLGSGCFSSSFLGLIGQLFVRDKEKLDSVVTFTYLFINLSAFIGPILVGVSGFESDWTYVFIASMIIQILSLVFIYIPLKQLPEISNFKSISSQNTSNSSSSNYWIAFVFIAMILWSLFGGIDLSAYLTYKSVPLLITRLVSMFGFFLILGLWWWFKPISATVKLGVGFGFLIMGLVISGISFTDTNTPLVGVGISLILITGLVEVLLFPILMSILLQRCSLKYIATGAALLSVTSSVVAYLVTL